MGGLEQELSEWSMGTLREWMRTFVDDREGSAREGVQVRVKWYADGVIGLCEDRYSEPFARFQVSVNVVRLPDLPPVGPECDPAQIEEMQPGCSTLGVGHSGEFLPCDSPLPCGVHNPAAPEWVAAAWRDTRPGDRVRLGTAEADVEKSVTDEWHADNSNRYQPKKWDHLETHVTLKGRGAMQFPPNGPVEILMDAERRAIHEFRALGNVEEVAK